VDGGIEADGEFPYKSLSHQLDKEIAEEEDYEEPEDLIALQSEIDFVVDDDEVPGFGLATTLMRTSETEIIEVVYDAENIERAIDDDDGTYYV